MITPAPLGAHAAAATAIADKYFCGIGAHNLADQTVIAGESADLDKLVAEMEAAKKRAVRLKTEGAFHTYLMVNAAQQFLGTARAKLEKSGTGGDKLDVESWASFIRVLYRLNVFIYLD